mgnify:CR=1 FL=1
MEATRRHQDTSARKKRASWLCLKRACQLLLIALLTVLTHPSAHAQTLTKPPELTRFVEAAPPPEGGTAQVLLLIQIDATGKVTQVEVLESGGEGFDQAAVEAALAFEFQPAEVDGEPAAISIQYRYTFTERIEEPPPKPTIAALQGQLRLSDGTPVAQGRLEVVGVPDAVVITDSEGRFAFESLPPGVYDIEISAPGTGTLRLTEDLQEPVLHQRIYELEVLGDDVDEELVIRAPRTAITRSKVSIKADEARKVPGTQGDTLKVVQSLPGVARASAGSGALVVWGAAPEDTRVLVDGVEIPALYHLGGVRSTINSSLVESIELIPGAFGPAWGRGLGGLVLVETSRLDPEAITGYVGADLYDTSAMLSAPVGERLRLGAAGRFGYLDQTLTGFVQEGAESLFPIPRYRDFQLKAELDLRPDEWVGLTMLYSDDALQRQSGDQIDREETSYLALIMPYRRLTPEGASYQVTPHVVTSRRLQDQRFGQTPARLEVNSTVAGLRANYRAALSEPMTLEMGIDAQAHWATVERLGSLNRPPREGDIAVFGQPPGDDVAADRQETLLVNMGLYASVETRLGPVVLVPGLRVDLFGIQGDRLNPPVGQAPPVGFLRIKPALAPRLSAKWQAVDALELQAAVGVYHQPPRPEELSAVFGNPQLNLSNAQHAVLGLTWSPEETISVEVTGFFERFGRLVARSPLETPPLAAALTNDGSGQSTGVQFLLRRSSPTGLSGWLSYTLSRSQRQDFKGGPTRLFDFDQTHQLSLVLSYTWKSWTLGSRSRFSTGFPRTEVIDAFYDARADRFSPVFGRHNGIRIPNFFQQDLRAEYAFDLGPGQMSLYLDIQNITNQRNAEELAYNFDFSQQRLIPGLPTLALLGGRFEF